MSSAATLTDYAELLGPAEAGTLEGNAWQVWNKAGAGQAKDRLGALNLLTPATILQARDEIQKGIRVQLDWSLENLDVALANRQKLVQKVIDYYQVNGKYVHDDVLTFNTQIGSQWDGFGHYAEQSTGTFYNNVKYAEIAPSKNEFLGIHNWCNSGGIVGRGVLLDYVHYREARGLELPDPWTRHEVPIAELDQVAAFQNVTFKPGDILLVRLGFVRRYEQASPKERQEAMDRKPCAAIGIQANEQSRDWLWNHHFSAVAGDTLTFEAYPFDSTGIVLHEYLLPRFGMPIGEMFNLEQLSEVCKAEKRWEFFFTSAPLNVPGGFASPPNAIAVL
ncbi:hypothetical protein A1O3_00270 [Capronia epimyces CBS 606.96]|uniref:Cyclase n=1 Tax=Capronia epimyces CBS 606.96 TaxID=1182542 RepID=W9YPX3_9EURO|nr:uncharacterized protein A1O3_00270 [Capronia epimyces CBS 606.96]EXJ91720.1 hypothetical protein A1O3_00270 [Capronia epimyces CBS 606.96]